MYGTFIVKQVGCGQSKAVSSAKQSAARHFRKKVRDIYCEASRLRTVKGGFSCQTVRRCALWKKKYGTFIAKQVGCGQSKAVLAAKQSAARHSGKKVRNIYCEASRLRTADGALWTGEARTHALSQVYKVNIVFALVSL